MARPVTAIAPLKQNQDQIDESGKYKFTEDGTIQPLPAAFASGTIASTRNNRGISAASRVPSERHYSLEANGDIQLMMKAKVVAKWGEEYWPAMHYILDHESGSDPYVVNKTSGACGIPQALPCSKLLNVVGSLDNIDGQLDWMIDYVAKRYSNPINAMEFWQSHHWY